MNVKIKLTDSHTLFRPGPSGYKLRNSHFVGINEVMMSPVKLVNASSLVMLNTHETKLHLVSIFCRMNWSTDCAQ